MTKPVVHYRGALAPIEVGHRATLFGVFDHPDQLNVPAFSEVVYTTVVQAFDVETGNFETKNTQYVHAP